MKIVDAKWCCEHINSGHFEFKNVLGEVKEVFEARTLAEVKEELGDVVYFWNCWLYSNFKVNLPMIGAMDSVAKFTSRIDTWMYIFFNHGLRFDPKYLVNGSNFAKPEKIKLALEMARRDQYEH